MVFKKGVICFGSLLVYCIISLLFSVVYSADTNATSLWTDYYGIRLSQKTNPGYCNNSNPNYSEHWVYDQLIEGCGVETIVPISQEIVADGDTIVYSGKLNLVQFIPYGFGVNGWFTNLDIGVRSLYFGNYSLELKNANISYYVTPWSKNIDGHKYMYETLTIVWTITAYNSNIKGTTGWLFGAFYNRSNNQGFFDSPGAYAENNFYYFENTGEPLNAVFVDTGGNDVDLSPLINQIQQQLNQDNNYYSHEYEAESNITTQTPSDISNTSSSQTTSLIGVISNFISSLSSYNATSCSLTLPFPNYAGGTTTVDPCSGKEIAPTIVQVASSLLLICTFVPLAFIVLRMIYNEIRSWTNG